MIRWAIFSTLASGIIYGCYCLLLRSDRWLMVSRSMLVCSLLFSLLLPLLRIPDLSHWPLTDSPLYTTMYLAPVNIMPPDGATEPASNNISAFLPAVLYLAGVALMLAMLATDIVRTVLKLYRLPVRRHGRLRLHLIDDNSEPCSFFNHIVIGTRAMSRNEILCILAHEGAHLRMWHSWDVLAMRLMCCASWFNPFSWLMLNELRAVHEYQADEAALGSCSRKAYIGLLYRQATGFGYGHITNNFQSINIKKRITMMKRKKTRFGAWKTLALLPVAALLMAFGSRTDAGQATTETGHGRTLLEISYSKQGGLKLPLVGFGYLNCHSKLDLDADGAFRGNVSCSGEGWGTSWHNWELSDFTTSKGRAKGKVLNRMEKRMLKEIDRQIEKGVASGSLSRKTKVKTDEGRVGIVFTAIWQHGTPMGDAEILFTVKEEGANDIKVNEHPLVETSPEFPGGVEALYRYMAENIRYPEQAKIDGVQGRVFVRFVIDTDGSVKDAKVLRGIGSGCDEEALRVVNAMPKWRPGTVDGKPVRAEYNLPINFQLK